MGSDSEMRVLLVQESFLPSVGGAELHVLRLGQALRRRGHEVSVVTATPGSAEVDGIPTTRIPAFSHQGRLSPFVAVVELPRALLRVRHEDVVHGHYTAMMSAVYGLAARTLGRRFVVTLHGYGTLESSVAKSSFSRLWRWMSMRLAHVVIATTEEMRDIALAFVPPEKIALIRNGVDTERFAPQPYQAHEGMRLVTVRRLVPKNGVQYLVEAMPRLIQLVPGAHLEIVGDGPLRRQIEDRIGALGIADDVELVGAVANDEVRDALYRSDIVVFPSRAEGFSLAALEAMSCGRAVVASDVGGFRVMLDGGRLGVLVDLFGTDASDYDAPEALPAERLDELTRAIASLGQDPQRMRELGEQASEWVRARFDWMAISKQVESTYRDGEKAADR